MLRTYVARSVMYVPPMTGSAMRAWKALIATNMTVLVKVLKMCDAITTSRYDVSTPFAGNIMTVNWAITAAMRRATKAQLHSRMGVYFVLH